MGTAVSIMLLVGVLGFAVVRPRGLPEAAGAVPAALLAVLFGLVSWRDAGAELRGLAPTVGFLAAVLLLAFLADELGLLAMAALAALLANLLNNLPATLMLLPLAAQSRGLVLAVLLGANIGPNLTYVGSLATLLWRQILRGRGHPPVTGEFLRLGVLTVPAGLLVGVAARWLSLRVSAL